MLFVSIPAQSTNQHSRKQELPWPIISTEFPGRSGSRGRCYGAWERSCPGTPTAGSTQRCPTHHLGRRATVRCWARSGFGACRCHTAHTSPGPTPRRCQPGQGCQRETRQRDTSRRAPWSPSQRIRGCRRSVPCPSPRYCPKVGGDHRARGRPSTTRPRWGGACRPSGNRPGRRPTRPGRPDGLVEQWSRGRRGCARWHL